MNTKQETPTNPTEYICVAAHFYGTGSSLPDCRKNLVKAGGSPQEEQVVYKLPQGATGAFVADSGTIHWYGVEGEMKPIFRYKNGKAVCWVVGEDAPIPYQAPTAKTVARHAPTAQAEGALATKPASKKTLRQLDIERQQAGIPAAAEPVAAAEPAPVSVSQPTAPNKKTGKTKAPKIEPAKLVQELADKSEPEGEADQPPTTGHKAAALKKPKLATAASATKPEVAAPTANPPKPAKQKPAQKVDTTVPAGSQAAIEDGKDVADFLLFIGSNYYTKDNFISEAAQLGISRRMPSHHISKGLVCGHSRVFVAAEGERKADGSSPVSEVFGYFTPSAVEFIANGNQEYADIIATLKLRDDARIIDAIDKEPARQCGQRKEGGTYIVVTDADSALTLLDKPAQYEGNHFRGMMRLDVDQSDTFIDGCTVSVLCDEHCMKCNTQLKVSPDGHARAERERRRIVKGQEAKWQLLCTKCQKEVRAARAAADGVEAANESGDSVDEDADAEGHDPIQGTD